MVVKRQMALAIKNSEFLVIKMILDGIIYISMWCASIVQKCSGSQRVNTNQIGVIFHSNLLICDQTKYLYDTNCNATPGVLTE